jgi:hypothetical protein
MVERWETYDERGAVTGALTKETERRPASFSRPRRSRQMESPWVDAICMIVGFIMLAATVALFWAMATAA